jgi:large subunit ribosomal protein L30
MKDVENKIIAAVRVRGRVNVRSDINETLDRLRLRRVNNCVIIKMNDSYSGMINACHDYIAFGEPDEETIKRLVKKAGIDISPSDIIQGKYDQKALKAALPIRLHPPRHGYKSTKLSFKRGGSLGYMGKEINNLIQRMVK